MADPVIGQLYNADLQSSYPPAQQPNGIGTPVTAPLQATGQGNSNTNGVPQEINGRFRPGCGHSIMSYDVARAAVSGVSMCLILCPLCGYIQNIISPAQFYDPQNSILLA